MRKSMYWFIILIVCFIIASFLILIKINSNYATQIIRTELLLQVARQDVTTFKNTFGKYPEALHEIIQYSKTNQKLYLHDKMYVEFLSTINGNGTEHTFLNGQGGYYYDPDTGEVKVNLIKPIKHYLPLYFGKKRNETPSDW